MRVTPGSAGSRTPEGQRAGAWGGRLSQGGMGSLPALGLLFQSPSSKHRAKYVPSVSLGVQQHRGKARHTL